MDPASLVILTTVGAKAATKAVDDVLRPWLAKVRNEASADTEERQKERLRVLLSDRQDVDASTEAELRRLIDGPGEHEDDEPTA